jgi:hypothetical protein
MAKKLTQEEIQKQRDVYLEKILGKEGQSLITKKESDRKTKTPEEIEKEKKTQQELLSKELEKLSTFTADQSNSIQVTKDCNKLLDDARALLKDENYDTNAVIAKFDLVKQRLVQAFDSRAIRQQWFTRLFIMIVGLFVVTAFFIGWYGLIPGQDRLENTAWVILACALWGCIGSIVDAFVAMNLHFGNQDFDRHFLPWYFTHQFKGFALGAVVYLVIQAGLLTTSGTPLSEPSANTTIAANVPAISGLAVKGATAFPLVLAFLAGFRQNAIVNFLNRLVSSFFPEKKDDGGGNP